MRCALIGYDSMIQDDAAIQALRQRRAHWFFGDIGPVLPAGVQARWRVTPGEPHGWQSNMIGFVQAPPGQLGAVLDLAVTFFTERGADTWVDTDEFSPLWDANELLTERGFSVHDNWLAMICRQLQPSPPTAVRVRAASSKDDLQVAAWIGEQNEAPYPLTRDSAAVQRRFERYWSELHEWRTEFALAELDGRPVGTARLTDEVLPVVVGVATLLAARGRGAATAITAYLTAHALERRGACALYVERDSAAARIYTRLGYTPLFRTRAWQREVEGAHS